MSIGFVSCLKKYYKFGRQISKYLHCEDLVLLHEPEVQDFTTERVLPDTCSPYLAARAPSIPSVCACPESMHVWDAIQGDSSILATLLSLTETPRVHEAVVGLPCRHER